MEKWWQWSHLTLNYLRKWSSTADNLVFDVCMQTEGVTARISHRKTQTSGTWKKYLSWQISKFQSNALNKSIWKTRHTGLQNCSSSLLHANRNNICSAGMTAGEPRVRKTWGHSYFFPFRQKLRVYCSRQIIKIAELIYWLEQNVHAVPFYIVISRQSHFGTETTWLLKKTKDKCFLLFHKNSLSFKWNILSQCNGKNGFNWYSLIPSSHKLPSF